VPVNREKMAALKKQYGAKRGEDVYFAMEQKAKSRKKGKRR